jgi:pilus assembly protein Flp/PilA
MFSFFSNKKQEKGQGLVEYAIILALIAIVVIGVMTTLGKKVNNSLNNVNTALDGGVPQLGSGYLASIIIFNDQTACNNSSSGYTWGNGNAGVGCYLNP